MQPKFQKTFSGVWSACFRGKPLKKRHENDQDYKIKMCELPKTTSIVWGKTGENRLPKNWLCELPKTTSELAGVNRFRSDLAGVKLHAKTGLPYDIETRCDVPWLACVRGNPRKHKHHFVPMQKTISTANCSQRLERQPEHSPSVPPQFGWRSKARNSRTCI